MKIKTIHLWKKYEELERDYSELTKLVERISNDRDYSDVLKKSFQSEIINIQSQKQEILNTRVEKPESPAAPRITTGNVKKLYADSEKKLQPQILVENIEKNQNTKSERKNEKIRRKY